MAFTSVHSSSINSFFFSYVFFTGELTEDVSDCSRIVKKKEKKGNRLDYYSGFDISFVLLSMAPSLE